MRASTLHDDRDSTSGTTARLVFSLLAGNVMAIAGVAAFQPFPGQNGFPANTGHMNMVLAAGVLSIVSVGLLFMLPALRRGLRPWWMVAVAVNLVQVGRLGPAVAAIGLWPDDGGLAGLLWAFVAVPILAALASLGIVVTVREVRRSKRRRLSHAA